MTTVTSTLLDSVLTVCQQLHKVLQIHFSQATPPHSNLSNKCYYPDLTNDENLLRSLIY